jgi:hypothetical protein
MLTSFTILIILIVTYAYLDEGLFTAFCMFLNVLLAGLIAFNFWEPLAEGLESGLEGSFLHGYEDAICLVVLFALSLGLLRAVTNTLAHNLIAFPLLVQRTGAILFGLGTGYLVTGFLVCMLMTLPWHVNFLFYDPKPQHGMGRFFPPDRVWLATMRRAGGYAFANQVDPVHADEADPEKKFLTFDKYGGYIPRYARYRRYADNRGPIPYQGECDAEVQRGSTSR